MKQATKITVEYRYPENKTVVEKFLKQHNLTDEAVLWLKKEMENGFFKDKLKRMIPKK